MWKWRMHTIGGGGWMDCEVQWTRMEQDSSPLKDKIEHKINNN